MYQKILNRNPYTLSPKPNWLRGEDLPRCRRPCVTQAHGVLTMASSHFRISGVGLRISGLGRFWWKGLVAQGTLVLLPVWLSTKHMALALTCATFSFIT